MGDVDPSWPPPQTEDGAPPSIPSRTVWPPMVLIRTGPHRWMWPAAQGPA